MRGEICPLFRFSTSIYDDSRPIIDGCQVKSVAATGTWSPETICSDTAY